jgi:RimJ/RimL family protein N-acetyltransferase
MDLLETPHLRLERICEKHGDFLRSCLTDPELMIPAVGRALSLGQANQSISNMQRHWEQHGFGQYVGFLKKSDEAIGIFGLKYLTIEENQQVIDLGALVVKVNQRKGFALEASKAILRHGFDVLGLKQIHSVPSKKNRPAQEALRSHGFRFVRDVTRITPSGIVCDEETLWVLEPKDL